MHASCIKSKGQEPELYLIHHKKREKKEKERKWKREQNTFVLLLEQHAKEPEANSRHGMMENVLSFRPSFVAVLQFDAIRKTDSHEHLVNI